MLSILLVIVALGFVTFITFKSNNKKRKPLAKTSCAAKREGHDNAAAIHPFHCVSIENEGNCCKQVEGVKGKRFLSKEAPDIPMKDCTQAQCQCHYQHYDDRRQVGNDRRVDYGITKDLYGAFGEHNRREQPKGRRLTDH